MKGETGLFHPIHLLCAVAAVLLRLPVPSECKAFHLSRAEEILVIEGEGKRPLYLAAGGEEEEKHSGSPSCEAARYVLYPAKGGQAFIEAKAILTFVIPARPSSRRSRIALPRGSRILAWKAEPPCAELASSGNDHVELLFDETRRVTKVELVMNLLIPARKSAGGGRALLTVPPSLTCELEVKGLDGFEVGLTNAWRTGPSSWAPRSAPSLRSKSPAGGKSRPQPRAMELTWRRADSQPAGLRHRTANLHGVWVHRLELECDSPARMESTLLLSSAGADPVLLKIRIPRTLALLGASVEDGRECKWRPCDGGVLLLLPGSDATKGGGRKERKVELELAKRRSGSNSAEKDRLLDFPSLNDDDEGWMVVCAPSDGRIVHMDHGECRRVNLSSLPRWIRRESFHRVFAVFRYDTLPSRPPSCRVMKLEERIPSRFAVRRLEASTVVAPDGSSMTRLELAVLNDTAQFLVLHLPREAEVLSVIVENRPSRAGCESSSGERTVYVPLLKSTRRDDGNLEPLDVLVVYSMKPQAPAEDTLTLILPGMECLAEQLGWNIRYPSSWELEYKGDELSIASGGGASSSSFVFPASESIMRMSSSRKQKIWYSQTLADAEKLFSSSVATARCRKAPEESRAEFRQGLYPLRITLPPLPESRTIRLESANIGGTSDEVPLRVRFEVVRTHERQAAAVFLILAFFFGLCMASSAVAAFFDGREWRFELKAAAAAGLVWTAAACWYRGVSGLPYAVAAYVAAVAAGSLLLHVLWWFTSRIVRFLYPCESSCGAAAVVLCLLCQPAAGSAHAAPPSTASAPAYTILVPYDHAGECRMKLEKLRRGKAKSMKVLLDEKMLGSRRSRKGRARGCCEPHVPHSMRLTFDPAGLTLAVEAGFRGAEPRRLLGGDLCLVEGEASWNGEWYAERRDEQGGGSMFMLVPYEGNSPHEADREPRTWKGLFSVRPKLDKAGEWKEALVIPAPAPTVSIRSVGPGDEWDVHYSTGRSWRPLDERGLLLASGTKRIRLRWRRKRAASGSGRTRGDGALPGAAGRTGADEARVTMLEGENARFARLISVVTLGPAKASFEVVASILDTAGDRSSPLSVFVPAGILPSSVRDPEGKELPWKAATEAGAPEGASLLRIMPPGGDSSTGRHIRHVRIEYEYRYAKDGKTRIMLPLLADVAGQVCFAAFASSEGTIAEVRQPLPYGVKSISASMLPPFVMKVLQRRAVNGIVRYPTASTRPGGPPLLGFRLTEPSADETCSAALSSYAAETTMNSSRGLCRSVISMRILDGGAGSLFIRLPRGTKRIDRLTMDGKNTRFLSLKGRNVISVDLPSPSGRTTGGGATGGAEGITLRMQLIHEAARKEDGSFLLSLPMPDVPLYPIGSEGLRWRLKLDDRHRGIEYEDGDLTPIPDAVAEGAIVLGCPMVEAWNPRKDPEGRMLPHCRIRVVPRWYEELCSGLAAGALLLCIVLPLWGMKQEWSARARTMLMALCALAASTVTQAGGLHGGVWIVLPLGMLIWTVVLAFRSRRGRRSVPAGSGLAVLLAAAALLPGASAAENLKELFRAEAAERGDLVFRMIPAVRLPELLAGGRFALVPLYKALLVIEESLENRARDPEPLSQEEAVPTREVWRLCHPSGRSVEATAEVNLLVMGNAARFGPNLGGAALTGCMLDGREILPCLDEKGSVVVPIRGRGRHRLTMRMLLPLEEEEGVGGRLRASLPLQGAACCIVKGDSSLGSPRMCGLPMQEGDGGIAFAVVPGTAAPVEWTLSPAGFEAAMSMHRASPTTSSPDLATVLSACLLLDDGVHAVHRLTWRSGDSDLGPVCVRIPQGWHTGTIRTVSDGLTLKRKSADTFEVVPRIAGMKEASIMVSCWRPATRKLGFRPPVVLRALRQRGRIWIECASSLEESISRTKGCERYASSAEERTLYALAAGLPREYATCAGERRYMFAYSSLPAEVEMELGDPVAVKEPPALVKESEAEVMYLRMGGMLVLHKWRLRNPSSLEGGLRITLPLGCRLISSTIDDSPVPSGLDGNRLLIPIPPDSMSSEEIKVEVAYLFQMKGDAALAGLLPSAFRLRTASIPLPTQLELVRVTDYSLGKPIMLVSSPDLCQKEKRPLLEYLEARITLAVLTPSIPLVLLPQLHTQRVRYSNGSLRMETTEAAAPQEQLKSMRLADKKMNIPAPSAGRMNHMAAVQQSGAYDSIFGQLSTSRKYARSIRIAPPSFRLEPKRVALLHRIAPRRPSPPRLALTLMDRRPYAVVYLFLLLFSFFLCSPTAGELGWKRRATTLLIMFVLACAALVWGMDPFRLPNPPYDGLLGIPTLWDVGSQLPDAVLLGAAAGLAVSLALYLLVRISDLLEWVRGGGSHSRSAS